MNEVRGRRSDSTECPPSRFRGNPKGFHEDRLWRPEGDPEPSSGIDFGQMCEWQFRVSQAISGREDSSYFLTLTFADYPDDLTVDQALRKFIRKFDQHFRRNTFKFWRDVSHISATEDQHFNAWQRYSELPGKFEYFACVERGTKGTKRLHCHCVFIVPYPHWNVDCFDLQRLKWKYGFTKIEKVKSASGMGLYAAKYLTKEARRIKCSSNFGLATTTLLLSMPSWNLLARVHPTIFQKLLRRLCLTPNYPTLRKINYLLSSVSVSTLSTQQRQALRALQPTSGTTKREIFFVQARNWLDGGASLKNLDAERVRFSRYTLYRLAVEEIRAQRADSSTAISTIDKASIPAVDYLGKPRPLSAARLGADYRAYVWLRRSQYPRCARRRAAGSAVPVPE